MKLRRITKLGVTNRASRLMFVGMKNVEKGVRRETGALALALALPFLPPPHPRMFLDVMFQALNFNRTPSAPDFRDHLVQTVVDKNLREP